MRFDDSKIEEIKSRVDIVDLASEYLTLKKAGRNYLGLCPFHQEKTPSFTVNREKQIFYCFGCGEGGNAITLLMKMANKSFPEAIKYLAEKTGVILPARTFSSEGRAKESLHEQIVNLNYRVAQQYARNLASQVGKAARDYIQKRGLSEETVKQFRLGYAPDNWRATADFIEGAGLSLKLAEQAGLVIAGKDGGYYDRFRGRLIFPIENVFGEVIAFGGRILDAGEPKYLNSPETPVYIKGKNLYGLNKTKEAIRQKGFCLIVEGYFDAISLYNAGIHNVVATLGTALTRDHLELLRRYTQNVVALFDPDAAGRKALDRSLELFLEVGMHARALVLPGGDDPDVYVRSFGREALEDLIVHAPPISDYYIDNVLGNGKTFEENRDLVKTAKEFVNKIGDEIEKNLFIKRISEKLGIDQSLLKREVLRREGYRKPSLHVTTDSQLNSNPLEMNLIRLMLEYPQKTELIERERILDYFMDARLKVVGEKIVQDYKLLGYVDMNVILSADEDKKIREALYRLSIEAPPTDDNVVDRNFSDNIKRIREKWYKEKHRQLKIKLVQAQSSGNDELLQQLMVEKQKLMNAEREIR